jgi:hypothetical protein
MAVSDIVGGGGRVRVAAAVPHDDDRRMVDAGDDGTRDGPRGPGAIAKFFVFLLALAGLGLGIWLFGRRRRSGKD